MSTKIPKEEIEKILKIKGHISGMAFLEDKKFFLEEMGKNVLAEIEKKISEITGEEFSYKKIKKYVMYPLYFSVLTTLILKHDYNFTDEMIKKFGKNGAKVSLLIKLFLRKFYSLKQVFKQASGIWKRYFNVGNLLVEDFNEKEKIMVINIVDFNTHPLYCLQLEGVISQLISYVVKSEKLEVKEIECAFRGGKSHKFKITW